MYADIEALVLSGQLFNGGERSSSPVRSDSEEEDKGWHDEEFAAAEKERREKYEDKGLDYDSDTARKEQFKAQKEAENRPDSIGMGPGRTGVKGVIRDRNEAVEKQRSEKAKEAEEIRKKMEATSLGGKTFLEEEREKASRGERADDLVLREREKQNMRELQKEGTFGHLREVGAEGFVTAVERELAGVWVVVHIYDTSLDRCWAIDETLSKLARLYPETKFLRARASALGFASTGASQSKSHLAQRRIRTVREDDEDDPYGDDDADDDNHDSYDEDEENVDLDVLPTMLVYRGGELVHNWVRVDWEAGPAGLQDLLDKYHILVKGSSSLSFLNDDDDPDFDILLSDSD